MMDTSPIGTATASAQAASAVQSGTAGSKPMISSDFEMFLKMLTAQMTNQDPLNPIESSDYAVQLATFSGVEQQVRTNDLLQGLASQMGLTSMAQMAGWVGREARAAAPAHFDGTPITLAPNPAAVADDVKLVVKDSTGTVVQTLTLPVSGDPIEWVGVTSDGRPLPSGTYTFEVESYSQGELLISEPAELYQEIQEVRSIGGELMLLFKGGQQIPASQVTALRNPLLEG